ncbi:HAD-IIA family hydrolase [Streptomyces sp. URMC 127]|uniref:HAD-IIA family hydrolase n=1 Tax=Streptomyces sp. URMC 127 TaxID=3423402 RepID=UPI003F1B7D9A
MNQTVRTRPDGSERPLGEAYDTALLDLDGVVYAGGEAIAHAVESLAAAREGGMHLAYVTNNAARTPDTVAGHLTELGVPAAPSDVITSAQAVARLISEQVPAGSRVLVIGAEGLRVALRERGLVPVDSAADDPAAVAQGYGGPDMPWSRLMEASYAVAAGVPWFASNTDLTIPTGRGIAPGNGSAVEVVRIATGATPRVAGKPQPPMHRETVLRTGAERPLVVGDRLDTDIEGAYAGGVDSLLVLTGVTTAAELVAARPEHRPTFVAADLRGLLVAQPGVVPAGDGFRCGGWTASVDGDALALSGEGDPVDGLRALCAMAWTAGGGEACGLDSAKAVALLGL